MNFFHSSSDWSDRLNPVFIKEMRQYFQNRKMVSVMGIMLAVEFVISVIFFNISSLDITSDTGLSFFFLIIASVSTLSVLICSGGAHARFAEERSDKELNYAMITTLKPASIIWGKLAGALVMTVFFFSVALPFLAAAYFMRGLSFFSLLFILMIVPIILFMSLLGIFAGAFGQKLITILYGLVLLCLCFMTVVLFSEFLNIGRTGLDQIWTGVSIEFFVLLLSGILLFLLAAAVIAPPKSNWMLPPKVYLVSISILLYLIGQISAFWISPAQHTFMTLAFMAACIAPAGSAILLSIFALFEPESAGPRVLLSCPKNMIGRCLHFLFSTGYCGSLTLAVFLLILSILAVQYFLALPSSISNDFGIGFLISFVPAASTLSYAIISIRLHKGFKKIHPFSWFLILEFVINTLFLMTAVYNDQIQTVFFYNFIMPVSPLAAFVAVSDLTGIYYKASTGIVLSTFTAAVVFALEIPHCFRMFKLHRRPVDSPNNKDLK